MTDRTNVTVLSLSIGHAARRCGVTVRAIRLYHEHGLLELARDARGNRTLAQRSLHRLEFIAMGRHAGLSISRIHQLLVMGDDHGDEARSVAMIKECRRRLAEIEHDRNAIQAAISFASDTGATGRRRGALVTAPSP